MGSVHIKAFCPLKPDCLELLQKSYEKFQFSARTHNKIIKITRTFADMDESKEILKKHMIYGLVSRDLNKDKTILFMYTVRRKIDILLQLKWIISFHMVET